MTLNGSELNKTFVPFREVVKGGRMTLRMGNTPKDTY
jgi:putative alpha-1,2-mannosidase